MEIKIDGWKCNLTFSSAHFLADYSKCSQLHGHTYAVHVIVTGSPVNGLVIDFRHIKTFIRQIIEDLDHKILIPTKGKFDIKEQEEIEIIYDNKRYVFPKIDCVFLPIYSSSAENLASYVLEQLISHLTIQNISRVQLGIDEGYGQGAWAEWDKKQSV
jgi:6-pyruvoyltetrahydropterin/6-carboxytetrahydropterin synthase